MFINMQYAILCMVRHKESGDSALRYYNKINVQLLGRGYDEAQASATALVATAKRYENYGVMTVGHNIAEKVMEKYGVNKIFFALYFSFVNAYLKQIRLGNRDKAENTIKEWVNKGADRKVLNEIVDRLGEVIE